MPRDERLEFAKFVERRVRGEPVAYIVGSREFFSLPLRRRAGRVDSAVGDGAARRGRARALLALATRPPCSTSAPAAEPSRCAHQADRPDARVTATDVSAAALAQRGNEGLLLGTLGLAVRWVESRWFEALPAERSTSIVSNPPYVARRREFVGPLEFEPQLALDGGADGLAAYRVLFAEAASRLNPGGALLVEHGADQRPELARWPRPHGWRVAAAHDDLAGRPRGARARAERAA